MNNKQIADACKNVAQSYKIDICCENLIVECHMGKHQFNPNEVSHVELYGWLIKGNLAQTFTNLELLLRIYLTMFITNATDETSFSKLKYIKNYLRNSLADRKFNDLSLICIERKILETIDFREIINSFIDAKSRRLFKRKY